MLILLLLHIVNSGIIETLDYSIDYLNVGYTTKFQFTFRLQSGLGKQGYLSLKMPFQIEGSLVGTIPQGVTIIYNEVSTSDCSPISEFPGSIFKDSNNWYHIQFLNLDGDPRQLESNTYYRVMIQSKTPFSNQVAQIQNSIEAMTIQDYSVTSWIKYDFNRVFALLEFTAAPPSTLGAVFTLLSTTPKLLDFRHTILVKITPTIPIERKSRIVIKMTDSDYQFQGEQCTSESFTEADNTTTIALTNTQYNCQIIDNILTVNLYQLFNTSLYFSFSIKNPKFVKTLNGGFTVMSMYSYANHIIEQVTIYNILQTEALTWGVNNNNLVTYFLWGLKLSDITLPSQLSILRNTATNPYYNSFKFTFYPSATTPLNLMLKISLNLNSDPNTMILEGSLEENLPRFDKNPVKCTIIKIQPMKIICSNVGSLTTETVYFFAIKMSFPYQAAPATLPIDFGLITITSLNDGINEDSIPLIASGRDLVADYSTLNSMSILSHTSSTGYTFAHSQKYSDSFACPSDTSFGLQYGDYEQRLIVTAKPQITDFSPSVVTRPVGYALYTNPKIIAGQSPLKVESPLQSGLGCSPTPGGYSAANYLPGTDGAIETKASKYTLLYIIRQPGAATIQSYFGGNAANDQFTVSIGPVYIQNNGSQFSNEDLIDFIGVTAEIIVGTPKTIVPIKGIIAINSYTMSGPNQMSNLKISISNFWTGTITKLDGTQFPAFIRVTGYLEQSIVDQAARLAVFFNNLSPFIEGTSQEGVSLVSCSSTFNSNQQCYGYVGSDDNTQAFQSIYNMHRIEFILDDTFSKSGPASPFQLVIPVSTVRNQNQLTFFIGTIKQNEDGKIYSKFIGFKSAIRTQTMTAPSVALIDPINAGITKAASSYKLDLSNIPNVGLKESLAKVYYGHTQATPIISPNSGILQGAVFFYQGKWNMIGSTFNTKALILNPGLTYEQKCVPYHYNDFYGFLCPMIGDTVITSISQYINIEGFNYPDKSIITPSGGYSGWSDNNGNIQSFSIEAVSTINPGELILSTTIMPIIQKGYFDQIIKWVFTTKNSIPKDGYISISFTSGSWAFTVNDQGKCLLKSSSEAIQIQHTCTITKTDGVEIKFTFSATKEFPSDTYTLIQYGISMPNSNAVDQTFSIITYTSTGVKIDSTNIGAGTLKFNNNPNVPSIEINNVKFERMNNGMRGQFQFNFKLINRGILYNQQLNFDLTMIASTTISKCHCSIKNGDDTQNFDWKSFSGSSFTTIIVEPINDLNSEQQYIFKCFNILTPNTYIAPKILMQSGATTLSQGTATDTPLTFSNIPTVISSTGFTIKKLYPQPSVMIQLEINLVLSQIVDPKTTIYINLPYYYNTYDNKQSLSCLMNDADSYCLYDNERTIKIKLFTLTIDSFTVITITIIGIMQPPQAYNDDKFFIMIDYDEIPSIIEEYGTLNDVTASSTIPQSLIVRDFIISNLGIRGESQYTYYLQTLGNIQVGQYLVIDLPSKDYGKLVQLKPPTSCTGVLESDGTTEIISSCESLGNRILLPLQAVLSANTKYIIKITGMTNMEASSCYIGLPQLSIITADKTTIQQLTTYTYSNINQFKLIADSYQKNIYWKEEINSDIQYTIQNTDDILRLNYNELNLKPGQYSNIISLGLIDKGYDKKLKFNLNSNSGSFKVINDIVIYPGDGKALTRIGCSGTTNPQSYYLYFTKEESEPLTYSEAGIIQVLIMTTKTELNTQYNQYDIPMFSKSIPVLIDFSDKIPVDDLLLDFELIPFNVDKPSGLKFESTSDTKMNVQITQENLQLTFTIISDLLIEEDIDVVPDYYSTLTIALSGNSAPYYTQSSTATIFKLVKDQTAAIQKIGCIFKMSLNQLSDYSNKQIITFKSDQYLTIYYHIIMYNGFEREFDEVKACAENNTQLRYSDYYQEQFGELYIKATVDYKFELKKLKARTWYKIKSWGTNLYGLTNSTDYVEFVTQNNNGRLMKLTFHFGTLITSQIKQDIACWLCYSFAYPCYNVLSYDAIFCSDSVNKDLSFNSTAIYSQYKMLAETTTDTTTDTTTNTTTDQNPDENTDENTQETNIIQTSVQYYFIPNQDLPLDNNWDQVIQGVADTNFLRYFVGNLTNSTLLYYVDPLQEVTFDKSPEIISTVKFTRGQTWLQISNIRLRQTGLIWGYITPKFTNGEYAPESLKPTNIQMKYFANCLNQSIDSKNFFIQYYELEAISHNFTDLTAAKWYNIYLIATQDSPSLWTETSDVYSYTNKTLRVSFNEPEPVFGRILVLLQLILILI